MCNNLISKRCFSFFTYFNIVTLNIQNSSIQGDQAKEHADRRRPWLRVLCRDAAARSTTGAAGLRGHGKTAGL